ncbi:hypothetical protein SAY86_007623 [Trapa natans]|uniref:Uncharacterized protein n=1 Tax=Trapa natans TaxID=22666 RepID=A0AAN7LEV1_TRANT|nr:hypothetical protein SAY86_007623 [Trapa natans]
MELQPSFCAALLIFILLPGRLHGEERMEALYEIDYRGPETHSSSPPPSHFHFHHGSQWTYHTVAGESSGNRKTLKVNHKVERIHG